MHINYWLRQHNSLERAPIKDLVAEYPEMSFNIK